MMSVVSSTTPGTDENSCRTPSIFTDVIAAPSIDDRRMRRSAFPIVVPKPRSNGCAENRPNFGVSVSRSTSRRFGLWNPFHSIGLKPPTDAKTGARERLLRVQLDDQLLLDRQDDVLPIRKLLDGPLEAVGVEVEPAGNAAALRGVQGHLDDVVLAGVFLQRD